MNRAMKKFGDEQATWEDRVSSGLQGDDTRSVNVVAPIALTARRLHQSREGNVSILVLSLGIVFYVLASMTWNTGMVTSAKIETQTAADSAAYSSSIWVSRGMNLTAGTNMAILRHITSAEAAWAGLFVSFGPWISWYKATSPLLSIPPPVGQILYAAAWLAILAIEILPRWVPFMFNWVQGFALAIPAAYTSLADLYQFQRRYMRQIPLAIQEQRRALEEYYDCDINLVMGNGRSNITAPLKRGNPSTILIPLTFRTYKELLNNDPSGNDPGSWNLEPELKWMLVGEGATWWTRGVLVAFATHLLATGWFHHVPTSQLGPLEFSPTFADLVGMNQGGWKEYTVVAAARKRTENADSLQPPRYPMGFMSPGLFSKPVNPVAYAQAETFNGIDGHLPWTFMPVPWRVWTPWGWSWESRLSHGDPTSIFPAFRDSLVPGVAAKVFTQPQDLGVTATTAGVRPLATH